MKRIRAGADLDLVRQIRCSFDRANSLYERLVLVVAPAGAGKTAAMVAVSDKTGFPYVNVNLALSELLLDVPLRDRPLRAPRLLGRILDDVEGPLLLDNLEILFDSSLQLQPLTWLRSVSRSRIIVATWNGTVEQGHVTYAQDGHPERRREQIGDVLVVTPLVKA